MRTIQRMAVVASVLFPMVAMAGGRETRTEKAKTAVRDQYLRYGDDKVFTGTGPDLTRHELTGDALKIEFVGEKAGEGIGKFYGYVDGKGGPFIAGTVSREGSVTLASPKTPLAFPEKGEATVKIAK